MVQLQKYSFLNYKEPVEDLWSYLQSPGTLGQRNKLSNSQHGHQGNVQQPCLCAFASEFEHALIMEQIILVFFCKTSTRKKWQFKPAERSYAKSGKRCTCGSRYKKANFYSAYLTVLSMIVKNWTTIKIAEICSSKSDVLF